MNKEASKQNIHPNRISSVRHSRKYSYAQSTTETPEPLVGEETRCGQNQSEYILQLEYELAQERQKSKRIEEHTIRQQTKVLQQIDLLETKFAQVETQKREMKSKLEENYKQLDEFKKVKGVAEAMVRMMQKVQNKSGTYHEAWRWIKKVVWEYQSIRKKGLEWKEAYDIMKRKSDRRTHTFSDSSDESSSIIE